MPNIPITDGFGLNLQASLDPKSAFAKYFQHPPASRCCNKIWPRFRTSHWSDFLWNLRK